MTSLNITKIITVGIHNGSLVEEAKDWMAMDTEIYFHLQRWCIQNDVKTLVRGEKLVKLFPIFISSVDSMSSDIFHKYLIHLKILKDQELLSIKHAWILLFWIF